MSMMPTILLAAMAGLPVLLALLLRVNAVYLFVSVAAGDLLVRYLADDAALALNAFIRSNNVPTVTYLVMLLVPVVLTLLILRKSLPTTKVLLHIPALVGCGLLVAALALPLLPSPLQSQVVDLPAGNVLRQSQDIIVGVTTALVLFLAWHSYRPRDGKSKKHGKH